MIAALDAWFERVAGAVHAFGGEVLKFIGDGVLAIFPVLGSPARPATRRSGRSPPRAPEWPISTVCAGQGPPPLPFGAALHLGEYCGAMSARPTGWISPPSARRSIWSAGWRDCAGRSAARCWSPARSPPRPPHR